MSSSSVPKPWRVADVTLVENCKRHGVPVESYLRDLFNRLPSTVDPETIAALTPARLAAARRRLNPTYVVAFTPLMENQVRKGKDRHWGGLKPRAPFNPKTVTEMATATKSTI